MQDWSAFLHHAAETVSAPFHAVLATVGIERTDAQLAAFLLALVVGGALLSREAGAAVRARRVAAADGEVVVIFHNADGSATPRIRFRDAAGAEHVFDSEAPLNAETVHVGARMPVVYDPANPNDARQAGPSPGVFRPILRFVGVAVVCGLIWYAVTPEPVF